MAIKTLILGRTPIVGVSANDNFVFNYGQVFSFAWFWFCPYGTPPFCQLGQSLTLGCIGEFTCVTRVLVLLAPTLASVETVSALLVLHPLDTDLPYSNSLLDFQFKSDLKFFVNFFRSIFGACFTCWQVVFLAWALKICKIFLTLRIQQMASFIHQLCSHVAVSHIFESVVQIFGAFGFG